MLGREQLIQTLETQRQRFLDEKVAPVFGDWNKTMQYYFTDTEEYWSIKLVNGKPESVQEGKVENPEIEYQMSTDTFLGIATKEISGMKAYMLGKIKVKAPMADLMKLQKLE